MNWKAKLKGTWHEIKISQRFRKGMLFGLLLVGLTGGTVYWRYDERYVSTEDAYLNANVVQIAAQITGQLSHLYVNNNQFVQKGQLLFELDAEPFKLAADAARAQLAINEAQCHNAEMSAARAIDLLKKKAISTQDADNALTTLKSNQASVELAKANVKQAELNLQYTRVYANTMGWITNMTLQEGNVIEANQPLFALVSSEQFWTDANFKETELEGVHSGQLARIVVDMYPGQVFTGIVDSISGGSGTAFALLPPQNATGNWVKVTQRVPVKVLITKLDARFPLRIGTTATVTIDKYSSDQKKPL